MTEELLTLYGANWCPDCRNAKQYLGEQGVQYHWVDVDRDAGANQMIADLNNGKRVIPTIVLPAGEVLNNPSNADLAKKLGLQTQAKMAFYDLIVIGSGPAGLTAALYAAREGLNVLVVERGSVGGQAAITDKLDNFPGFPDGISGGEFATRLARQADRFGVELLRATEVVGLRADGESWCVQTADDKEYGTRAVLIASGSTYRRLNVPGEDDFIGAGVHFCATCDGPFYKDQHIVVIGGGNSAAEESLFLTRFADKVTILVREDSMSASALVVAKVLEHPEIEVRFNARVTEFAGNGSLESIRFHDGATDAIEQLNAGAVFVFIGLTPNTKWLPQEIERNEYGFVVTRPNLETSMPGVFAAGDLRHGSTKQAASAAGEGATAALMIREYLNEH